MSEARESPAGEEVGTVGEEALKLLGAVSEAMAAWEAGRPDDQPGHARTPGWSDGLADLASDAAEALRASHVHGVDEEHDHHDDDHHDDGHHEDVDHHDHHEDDGDDGATRAGSCRWCPLCRAVHVLEQTHPEVRVHLLSAARSLLRATALVLEQVQGQTAPDPRAHAGPAQAAAGVERIDLDDDGLGATGPTTGPHGHDEETW